MAAAGIIARSEWRLRWRALVLIALIAWLAGSVAIAAFAASRRASTAFDRLLEATGTANAEGFVEGPVDPELFDQLARVPGVEGGGAASMFIVGPADSDLLIGGGVIGAAIRHPFGNSLGGILTEGRFPNQRKVDEIFVNEAFAAATGHGAGDRIDLLSMTNEDAERAEQTGEMPEVPRGPTVPVLITGVGWGAEDVSDVSDPFIIVTEAFANRYQDEIANLGSFVMLRIDPDRFEDVRAATEEIFPDGVGLERAEDFGARVREGITVQRIALLVFAGVAVAAGLLAVTQNLRRFLAMAANRREVLDAMGASRGLHAQAIALTLLPVAVAAAVASAATAIAVAPLLVTGLARQSEPDPGPWFDPLAMTAGVALLLAAIAVIAVISMALDRRRTTIDATPLATRVTRALRLRAGAATGVRFALDTGRGVGGVPTRSAIVGAAVGVAGVVATLTFASSIGALFERPQDWGATYDAVVEGVDEVDATVEMARSASDIDGVSAVAVDVYGETDETASILRAGSRTAAQEFEALIPVEGNVPLAVVEGRTVRREGEIVVGKHVLGELGVDVGDRVVGEWGDNELELTIVGVSVTPGIDDLGRSAYLTPEGLAELSDDIRGGVVLVDAQGVPREALVDRLLAADLDARPIAAPSAIDNLDELGSLPSFLIGFLGVISVVAGISAMVLTVRRRRGEIAILRSLGFVRGQVLAAVAAQSTTLAALALVAGLPAGFVAGRWIYQQVGTNVGFIVHTTFPVASTLVVVGAAVAAAVLAAATVTPSAQRLSPAATLRAE